MAWATQGYQRWLMIVVILFVGLWGGPVMALALGDDVSGVSAQVVIDRGSHRYWAVHEQHGDADVTAFANYRNQVFQLEIHTHGDLPPDPAAFMGDYAALSAQEELIPLRGRIVSYRNDKGDPVAEWTVYGLSGDFVAEATSFELAPKN